MKKLFLLGIFSLLMSIIHEVHPAPRPPMSKPVLHREAETAEPLSDEARDRQLLLSGMEILVALGNMVALADFAQARKLIPALIAAITHFASVVTRNAAHSQNQEDYIQHIAQHVIRAYMAAMAHKER